VCWRVYVWRHESGEFMDSRLCCQGCKGARSRTNCDCANLGSRVFGWERGGSLHIYIIIYGSLAEAPSTGGSPFFIHQVERRHWSWRVLASRCGDGIRGRWPCSRGFWQTDTCNHFPRRDQDINHWRLMHRCHGREPPAEARGASPWLTPQSAAECFD
jgi:hypothetical protein